MAVPMRNPLAMVGDSPTPGQDLLHFTRYVEPLEELIIDPATETPFTIGVFGKWGSGKTTLMQMVEAQLKERLYPNVWFNPWLYQTDDNLIVPLLQTLHDSLEESPVERFKASAQRVATVVSQVSASVLMKAVTLGQVSFKDVEDRVNSYNQKRAEAVSTIRTLRSRLQEVVNDLTEQGQHGKLVIYIDDLDRCVPTKIIGLLEAIKLFLDLKHTIFFVAIDREIVQQGIQVFYKDFPPVKEGLTLLTADYMDKMIQLPLFLHPLGPEQVGSYLDQLGLTAHLNVHNELFRNCLQPNPRKIKRVLNLYALHEAIVDRLPARVADEQPAFKKSLLAKLIIIQQQWYDLYRDVTLHQDLLGLLERVYRGDLLLEREQQWVFLGDRQKELRDLCTRYYLPGSRLAALFDYGDSFQDVSVDEYMYMLG